MVNENGGNGHKEIEEPKVKWCPLLNEYCKQERCALWNEVMKPAGPGRVMKMGVCSFNAMVMMLSEINQKTIGKQPQRIHLPGLGGS